MSTDTSSEAESPDTPTQQTPTPVEAATFDWGWFTLRASGPATRTKPLREGPAGASLSADITMEIERPIEDGDEFKQLVLRRLHCQEGAYTPVVLDILEDYPNHEPKRHSPENPWEVTVTAPVSAWVALAHHVEKTEAYTGICSKDPLSLLRKATDHDVAGPNCALAFAVVAGENGATDDQRQGIVRYAEKADLDIEDRDDE